MPLRLILTRQFFFPFIILSSSFPFLFLPSSVHVWQQTLFLKPIRVYVSRRTIWKLLTRLTVRFVLLWLDMWLVPSPVHVSMHYAFNCTHQYAFEGISDNQTNVKIWKPRLITRSFTIKTCGYTYRRIDKEMVECVPKVTTKRSLESNLTQDGHWINVLFQLDRILARRASTRDPVHRSKPFKSNSFVAAQMFRKGQ